MKLENHRDSKVTTEPDFLGKILIFVKDTKKTILGSFCPFKWKFQIPENGRLGELMGGFLNNLFMEVI